MLVKTVKYNDNKHYHMNLTEEQRTRLMARDKLKPTERRDNEFAVRNRLQQFLEFVPDANLILYNLPKDQLRKNTKLVGVLNDKTVYGLFDLVFQLLDLLDFAIANGSPEKPYVVKFDEYKGPFVVGYASPIKTEEPFDLAREQKRLWEEKPEDQEREKSKSKNYPMLRRMTYEEETRNLFINDYIDELVEHYQSDPKLLNTIHDAMMERARSGKPK
jgi:hypothetical protein